MKNKKEQDDVVFEEEKNEEYSGKNPQDQIKKLKEKLKKCENERQEYLDGWQRSKADFVNARKNDEKLNKNLIDQANCNLIEDLLPVIDSFEMAFANKEQWESVSEDWRKGIEYIHEQLHAVLDRYGVKMVGKIGDEFDPNIHEAVESVEVKDELEENKIVELVQTGYMVGEKLIRSAKVKISK